MASTGRPRATAQHLKLTGLDKWNKGYYADRNMTEGIVPKDTDIKPPKGLSSGAKKAWNVTVPALIQMRAISLSDFVELENLFRVYDELLKARKAIEDFDKLPKDENYDNYLSKRSRLNKWYMNTQTAFDRLCGRFGMTPSDRTSLPKGEDEDTAKDPLEVLVR